jgi:hypothetical protein
MLPEHEGNISKGVVLRSHKIHGAFYDHRLLKSANTHCSVNVCFVIYKFLNVTRLSDFLVQYRTRITVNISTFDLALFCIKLERSGHFWQRFIEG